jgi:hypothetical protein
VQSSLAEFAQSLPTWPIRISSSNGGLVFSYRLGEKETILFLVNGHTQKAKVDINLDSRLAPESSSVVDVITGDEFSGHTSEGTFHIAIDLEPQESRAMSVKRN